MPSAILVLNAGSSSLKFSLFSERGGELALELRGLIESISGEGAPHLLARRADGAVAAERRWPERAYLGHPGALAALLPLVREAVGEAGLVGVGHRVVHGGTAFAAPVVIDEEVLARLQTFVPLAPLHQPHALAPIRALRELDPSLPQVACFDTAFHRTLPAVAERFALPEALHEAGVRRYGFHGLSYEFIATALPELDPAAARGRTVAMHLGNGASLCALQAGRSVATTMGFSVLDGLPMGTRCGALDPGVLLWLAEERGLEPRDLERLLYDRSGLLGVSVSRATCARCSPRTSPGRASRSTSSFIGEVGDGKGSREPTARWTMALCWTCPCCSRATSAGGSGACHAGHMGAGGSA
jgi:acetate kinase